jgi:hypothetical protein
MHTPPCTRDQYPIERHVLADLEIPRGRIGVVVISSVKLKNQSCNINMGKDVPVAK